MPAEFIIGSTPSQALESSADSKAKPMPMTIE